MNSVCPMSSCIRISFVLTFKPWTDSVCCCRIDEIDVFCIDLLIIIIHNSHNFKFEDFEICSFQILTVKRLDILTTHLSLITRLHEVCFHKV